MEQIHFEIWYNETGLFDGMLTEEEHHEECFMRAYPNAYQNDDPLMFIDRYGYNGEAQLEMWIHDQRTA